MTTLVMPTDVRSSAVHATSTLRLLGYRFAVQTDDPLPCRHLDKLFAPSGTGDDPVDRYELRGLAEEPVRRNVLSRNRACLDSARLPSACAIVRELLEEV